MLEGQHTSHEQGQSKTALKQCPGMIDISIIRFRFKNSRISRAAGGIVPETSATASADH